MYSQGKLLQNSIEITKLKKIARQITAILGFRRQSTASQNWAWSWQSLARNFFLSFPTLFWLVLVIYLTSNWLIFLGSSFLSQIEEFFNQTGSKSHIFHFKLKKKGNFRPILISILSVSKLTHFSIKIGSNWNFFSKIDVFLRHRYNLLWVDSVFEVFDLCFYTA